MSAVQDSDHPLTRTAKALALPVFAAQFAFFSYIALHRFVDGDEGFYLLASRLVIMHQNPYLDFFYTQAPLLPYVYALWMKLFGVTWVSAKLLSALLTAVLGTLVYGEVSYQTRRWIAGCVAAGMFAGSSLIFGFYPVVKTYSLAGLLLFAAYVLVTHASATSARWMTCVGGLLFGLSVDTRSYLVLLVPLFIWWILRNYSADAGTRAVLWFVCGVVVGNLPAIWLFLVSPEIFLFNNVMYHAVRSEGGLVGMWVEKLFALLQAFLGGGESNGIQTSILFFVGLGFVFSVRRPRYAPRFAFQIALALGIISLLPTPVHPQYFCLCIPFLLLAAICVVYELLTDLSPGRQRAAAVTACGLLGVIYVAATVHDLRRYLITGNEVAGVESGLQDDYRMTHILEVSRAINEVAKPGEAVASLWPGYIFQSTAVAFPGLENDFGMPVSDRLTSEQRARYRIISPEDLDRSLAVHKPHFVVLRNKIVPATNVIYRQQVRAMEDGFRAALETDGYRQIRAIGDVSIYGCCSK